MGALLLSLLGLLATFASDGEMERLRQSLAAKEGDVATLQQALDGAAAAALPEALPLLFEALDRCGEQLGKSEVEAARARAAFEAAQKGDAAAAEAKKGEVEGAVRSGTVQQQRLDAVARAIPTLLDALVAANRGAAVPLLTNAYEASSRRLGELEREDEQQKGKLAQLSSRLYSLEQEKGDAAEIEKLASEKAELQTKVQRTTLQLEQLKGARRALVEATGKLLRSAKGAEVDAALKQLERRVDGKAAPAERALWVDLYARLGREEVPGELLGVALEMARALKKGDADLAKLRENYEKNKEQYFKATEQGQKTGTISVAVKNAFEAAQKAVLDATAAALALERLRAACALAVGPAVASLPEGAKRDKGVAALLTAARGERDLETRVFVLEGCGAVDLPSVREALRKLLLDDHDVKARLAALLALVELRDSAAIEVARSRLLAHENWRVRSAAVAALARVPEKESIEPLIRALEVEQGRVREDITEALQLLTGESFAMSAPVWKQWWEANGATFVLADAAKRKPRRVAAWEGQGEGKVSFYGITSVSKRVCFVLDVSLSMREPISAKSERTKFDVAKEQLKQAIAGLSDGDQFAVVLFAGSATRWSNKMTTVTTAVKQKATEWVDSKIELDQGTNIHAGLREAFTIAGMGARDAAYDSAIDTLFFLSDGDATVGEIQDPLEIRRLVREWNKLSRIRIHAIGVGEAPNIALLYGLAEDSGGQFQKR